MAGPLFHMAAGAPSPVAPFSHAVEVDGWIAVTGQMPNDPADESAPLPDTIEGQTGNVMRNLATVLESVGLGFEHVVMARIYLTRFEEDYQRFNAIWPDWFEAGRLPARTTIGVTALALGARIEIDLLVKRP